GADAERQRQDRDDRKRRIQPQQPRAVLQIAPCAVEKADGVHLIDLLANEGGVTELAAGRGARRVRAHAAGDVLVGFDREVRLELARAFIVPTAAAKET